MGRQSLASTMYSVSLMPFHLRFVARTRRCFALQQRRLCHRSRRLSHRSSPSSPRQPERRKNERVHIRTRCAMSELLQASSTALYHFLPVAVGATNASRCGMTGSSISYASIASCERDVENERSASTGPGTGERDQDVPSRHPASARGRSAPSGLPAPPSRLPSRGRR